MNSSILELLSSYLIGDLDFDSFEDLVIPLAWEADGPEQDLIDRIAAEIALVKDGVSDETMFRARIEEIDTFPVAPAPSVNSHIIPSLVSIGKKLTTAEPPEVRAVNKREYQHLLADQAELDRLIAMTPESAIIDRMSLESRRQQVVEEIQAFPVPDRWPAEARLVFYGEPVAGRIGIDASFGVKAVKAFTDAVAIVGADQSMPLADRGPIPNRKDFNLMITGTTRGSFGFELQEAVDSSKPTPERSPVENALEKVRDILKASTVAGDDSLASATTKVHPRAIASVRTFVKTILDNEATCALSINGEVFRYRDANEVRSSYITLDPKNIREWHDEFVGSFQGYLPKSKRAEFLDYDTRHLISLKVGLRAGSERQIQINDILNQKVSIEVHSSQVGNNTPSSVVVGINPQREWDVPT